MTKRRARLSDGFTLIEMVLAISIFAMVIAIMFSSFRLGISAWTQGERDIEYHQRIRAVADVLYRQISAAFPYWVTPGELDTHESCIAFFGDTHALRFVTYAPVQKCVNGLSLVEIWHESDRGLMLGSGPALASSRAELDRIVLRGDASATVLSPEAQSISFRYFDKKKHDQQGEWLEQWDPRDKNIRLPRMVEATVRFTDSRGRSFDETLLIPIVSNLL
ncbi:MAG: prepilin-type N-terminal cleavage/methylation domain-containing protein [Desulfobacterota bacterium]|nr:prepilin-type N-terminal cleavage/methylation domain-containing protein [Thermodesulfobacteriota bacterium]